MSFLPQITIPFTAALALAISTTGSLAKTDKYRLIWNNAPASSITVAWCQKDGDNARVHYGEENKENQELPNSHGVDRKDSHLKIESRFARLNDLKADTVYHFVIRDSNSESRRFSFRTAPAGAASFSFAAGGDSRNHRDARQRANRVVATLRPLFVCFGGDMISKPTHDHWAAWLDDWQLTTGKDGRMVPIIAARGNHEGKEDIHSFFDTPHADDYYAVGFGGDFLRIYTLNSNIVRGGNQGKWLADDLVNNDSTRWKLAHYHHPFRPHQSGKSEQDAQYKAWAALFFKHGMDLVIECDSHVVKRTWPLRPSNEEGSQQGFIRDDVNGTVFIGEGCWGAPLRRNNDDKSWTRASGSFNQVNWICVTPEKMFARSILADSVEDAASINESEPFTLPKGLEIWQPESGAEVVLRPRRDKSSAGVQPLKRYLYMSTPDGAQREGSAQPGIMVFDIDAAHKFVRHIDIPAFSDGLRGFTGCTATGKLYYSTSKGRLGCFDPETGKKVWESKFEMGCDRSCITPDGKRLYVPTGWWWRTPESGFIVVDAATGKKIDHIKVGPNAHNSIASLDGEFVFLGTQTTLTKFRAADGHPVQTISPVGESGVFPYCIDSSNQRAYVCLGGHVGMDVVDLLKGTVTHRVYASHPKTGEKIKHRTHGAGMTPDEKEVWISDQAGRKLFIFDITSSPPKPKGHVKLSMGGHGWVTFSLDGKYAYCHTPDIFDVATKKKIASLTRADGKPFASSKFIEVQMRGGKVERIGNEFGLGRRQ